MSYIERVKKFWGEWAKKPSSEGALTHRDVWQRWLEIETIKKFISKKERLLDAGCGNGFTTIKLAPYIRQAIGIDYSPEMIERAVKNLKKQTSQVKSRTKFVLRDVLTLDKSDFGLFDTVLSERCLINLGSFADQKKAIVKIAGVLKKGGRFIFIEGTREGRDGLNKLRKSVGLSPMPKVWYNIDFSEEPLIRYIMKYFSIEKKLYFGVYDFISRVVYPLYIYPKEPEYKSELNKIAAGLSLKSDGFEKTSRVIVLILKKK